MTPQVGKQMASRSWRRVEEEDGGWGSLSSGVDGDEYVGVADPQDG
jgi:hypothetical protein